MYADLHCHSTASDGEWSPEKVVDEAAALGIEVLALTDHDTLAGVPAAMARGLTCGVEVIAGCELTAYQGRVELHILAYFVDLSPESPVGRLIEKAREGRRERAFRSAALLRAKGIEIGDEDILEAAANAASIGLPHIAKALVKRGHAGSIFPAIKRFLIAGKPGYVSKCRFQPEEVIEAVHASGGIAILAHPGISPHDELIPPLFKIGLDGIEAMHSSHSEANQKFYRGLAQRYERVISGGSDFHGPNVKQEVSLGSSGVSKTQVYRLRKRAEKYASVERMAIDC